MCNKKYEFLARKSKCQINYKNSLKYKRISTRTKIMKKTFYSQVLFGQAVLKKNTFLLYDLEW